MTRIKVRLALGSYSIAIGAGISRKLPQLLSRTGLSGKVLVLTQPRVMANHGAFLKKILEGAGIPYRVLQVADGEAAKESKTLFRIYDFLLKNGFEREDTVLAFGGGSVGDVAGFAASTFFRGVPLVQMGTTLLAQVDSSIGGKTGINLAQGKNLVGTFYQPRLVVSDVNFLKTLPKRELVASLAEVIKYGVIRDSNLFRYLEDHSRSILACETKALEQVIFRSAQIKARVVERDEWETREERMILNYGHTWGHAFEAASGFLGIRHGEAVALGMVCAARLARRRKMFSEKNEERQNRLIERMGLPIRLEGYGLGRERVIRHMLWDKKKKQGRLRFILPETIGRVRLVEGVSLSEVKEVLKDLGGNP